MPLKDNLYQQWLGVLCQMIPLVESGLFMPDESDNASDEAVTAWPDERAIETEMLDSIRMARSRNSSVIIPNSAAGKVGQKMGLILTCPLRWNEQSLGVVSIRTNAAASQEKVIQQMLQWGGAWLQLILSNKGNSSSADFPLDYTTLVSLIEANDMDAAATEAATAVSISLKCDRVSIGLLTQKGIKVSGLSYSSNFDPRSNLIQQIKAAMQEALDAQSSCQDSTENKKNDYIYTNHQHLSELGGEHAVHSLLLKNQGKISGVLIFERESALTESEEKYCVSIAQLLGPLLENKQQYASKLSYKNRITQWISDADSHWLKAGFALLLIGAALLSFRTAPHLVSGNALLEGTIQRAIVSPFPGYIAESFHRAGDQVNKDEVLARLDDEEFNLEYQKKHSEKNEFDRQYRKALAALNHTDAKIYQAQISQVDAELNLLKQKLSRINLKAPFDGIVIEGDLSQLLGAPVDRGETLFNIAPLNQYRVVLKIDEQDIPTIHKGQKGLLTLSALPRKHFPIEVNHVGYVSKAAEADNFFRVEARFSSDTALLNFRPGMQGVGKIEVGSAIQIWIWFHKLTEWLQFQAWKLLP